MLIDWLNSKIYKLITWFDSVMNGWTGLRDKLWGTNFNLWQMEVIAIYQPLFTNTHFTHRLSPSTQLTVITNASEKIFLIILTVVQQIRWPICIDLRTTIGLKRLSWIYSLHRH